MFRSVFHHLELPCCEVLSFLRRYLVVSVSFVGGVGGEQFFSPWHRLSVLVKKSVTWPYVCGLYMSGHCCVQLIFSSVLCQCYTDLMM